MYRSFAFSLLLLCQLIPLSTSQNGVVTTELWCVAKNNAEDAALQAAIDWACGAGGADCRPIQQGGPCYDPSDLQTTASFVFNDYFLKNGMSDESCNFDNTAALTSLNPSHDNCKFPSSLSASNRSSTSASSTSSFGLGPSEDLNGSNQISQQWVWPMLTSLLLIAAYTSWVI